MSAITKQYTGLSTTRNVLYPGPDGDETHYYYGAAQPPSGNPEDGMIITFQPSAPGFIRVIDRLNVSTEASDTAQNLIRMQYWTPDGQTLLWQFNIQMALLVVNPNYNVPTGLVPQDRQLVMVFSAQSGAFPMEYFSFRHRMIKIGG